ncbi:reverse transcriptase domain-containing protein [Tanacetum coccineum]
MLGRYTVILEYVSQAAAANFNQGNTNSRPPMVANQNRFNQNQGNNFNQNRGTNFNQNRGNNFYQGQVYQPPTSQPPVYQAQPYQAPAPQMQGVSKTDFENYVKANDAILRNMQNQGQGLQNQMTNLTEMLSKFVNSNTASSSSSCSLPSNTVTNPKEDLKGITTRSGVAYQGPTIPTTSSPKVVERRTEVTKDMVFPTNNGITEDVQPPVVPVENQNPVSEPVVAPVSAPMPNPKPSIPYPSRRNDEKHRENANEQKEKFYEIFKDMSFEISFVDALTLMPKFASTLKALIGNKEKLSNNGYVYFAHINQPYAEDASPTSQSPDYVPFCSFALCLHPRLCRICLCLLFALSSLALLCSHASLVFCLFRCLCVSEICPAPDAVAFFCDNDSGSNSNNGSTMDRIVKKLKKFGCFAECARPDSSLGVEDVFRGSDGKVRFPWEKPGVEDGEKRNSVKLKSKPCVAELTLPESELRRLRNLAFRLKNKTRITGAGVTREMVAGIKDKWKSAEVVKLKVEGSGALNMKRMHEILEEKLNRTSDTVAMEPACKSNGTGDAPMEPATVHPNQKNIL